MGMGFGAGLRGVFAGSLLFGTALVTAVASGSLPAAAATPVSLYVTTSGSGNTCSQASPCGSIQNAITAAQNNYSSDDDVTINVAAGPYNEIDTIAASSLDSLTIAGAGASTTAVNGGKLGTVLTVSSGTVTISGLTIENGDSSGFGGGISNDGGTVSVIDSTLSGNSAAESGGGIWNDTTMTVTDSTLSGNTAASAGGGISNGGPMTVTDSTLWDNSASAGGGGIVNAGTLYVTGSTLSDNTAAGNGGGINSTKGRSYMRATIVANSESSGGDCLGSITDLGYNIDSDGTCSYTGTGSISHSAALDASLGALANNGGPTETMLPAIGSPANGVIPSSPATTLDGVQVCPRTDQREVASSGNCTIGAVESGYPASTLNVSPTSGRPGKHVTVSGLGFSPGETVKITYTTGLASPKSVTICTATAGSNTSYTCSGTIPPTATAGSHTAHKIVAKGLTSGIKVKTTFTLT